MEKVLSNSNKKIILLCEKKINVIDNNEYLLSYELEKDFSFDIDLCGLKVKLKDNELVVFDENGTYFLIQSPVIIKDNDKLDAMYDVRVSNEKLHFTLIYNDEDCNDAHQVETKIKKVNNLDVVKQDEDIEEDKDEDIVYNFQTKEIIVRKKVSRFIMKLIEFFGYRIDYSMCKAIFYREATCEDENQVEIKNIYDSYVYLLSDYKNVLSESRLKRFFYVFLGKEMDESIVSNIVNTSFKNKELDTLTRVSSLFKLCLEIFNNSNDKKERMIPFILMNYELVRCNVPSTIIYYRDFEYFKTLDISSYNDMEKFIKKIINNKYQERKYYKSLTEIEYEDIKNVLLQDEEMLKNKHNIEHIKIFGSFTKGKQRIDSDIDLAVTFSLDSTSEQIDASIEYIKELYFDKLHRYIDVMRLNEYSTDETKLLIQYAKEVF